MSSDTFGRQLRPGLIFEIAEAANIRVPAKGDKRAIKCPWHDDKTASAFVSIRNIFYCSVCTSDGGWTAKKFAQALGVPWRLEESISSRPRSQPTPDPKPTFTPELARTVWQLALKRARDDQYAEVDAPVYQYLSGRGMLEAWELGAFGILPLDGPLPDAIAWWAKAGYRIICSLYDATGSLVNIQARAIVATDKKTLFPSGSHAKGTMFASASALEILRGRATNNETVLVAEGLTDFLALSIASPFPVISAPGTGMASSCIGPWVAGREVLAAMDLDGAGDNATKPLARTIFENGGTRVRRVVWPDRAKDACDVVAKRGIAGLETFLRRTLAGLEA